MAVGKPGTGGGTKPPKGGLPRPKPKGKGKGKGGKADYGKMDIVTIQLPRYVAEALANALIIALNIGTDSKKKKGKKKKGGGKKNGGGKKKGGGKKYVKGSYTVGGKKGGGGKKDGGGKPAGGGKLGGKLKGR